MFNDLIEEYKKREPEGTDSWNPLKSELELWHRIRLFQVMGKILGMIPLAIDEMKILDVGCGVGRSTRMLLEFGARPENILGIDLRPDALKYARSVNPAISFQLVNDLNDWPPTASFNLVMQCTAFGSIHGERRRGILAEKMYTMLVEDGYIFWWDAIKANKFAGGDVLNPAHLFQNNAIVFSELYSLYPSFGEALNLTHSWREKLSSFFQSRIGHDPTHCAVLLKKDRA